MRARVRLAALLLGAGLAPVPALAGPAASDGRYVMGTVLEITLADAPDASAARRTLDVVFARASRLDALLSRQRPDSALARLNRHAGAGPQAVDPHLARLLAESIAWSRATAGSFDVTVGPLVRLWEEAARRGAPPTPAELAGARALVGAEGLDAAPPRRAEIRRPGACVDLGGIAKGYALDRLAEQLRAAGHGRALLSFGQSSVWALGAPPDAEGWRLLVRDGADGYAGLVTLRDQALAVSGSLGQWSEIAGRRYGHVIDPRTGLPLVRRAQAVVVAPRASGAEALAKALLILPAAEALGLLEAQPGVEALLLAEGRRWETSGWRAATRFEAVAAPPPQAPSSTQASRSSGSS